VATIQELTEGRGAELAFETSGSVRGQSDAVDVLRPQGKAAFVGIGDGGKSIDPAQFLHKEATLYGSKVMPEGTYQEMVRFMVRRDVRFEPIVTHRVPLVEGPAAFAEFNAGAAGKFILEMR
jgi:L-iditol 2-dehydrogenase